MIAMPLITSAKAVSMMMAGRTSCEASTVDFFPYGCDKALGAVLAGCRGTSRVGPAIGRAPELVGPGAETLGCSAGSASAGGVDGLLAARSS